MISAGENIRIIRRPQSKEPTGAARLVQSPGRRRAEKSYEFCTIGKETALLPEEMPPAESLLEE